jgi:hypothetical protein
LAVVKSPKEGREASGAKSQGNGDEDEQVAHGRARICCSAGVWS